MAACQQRGVSIGFTFIDVVAAFYNLLRDYSRWSGDDTANEPLLKKLTASDHTTADLAAAVEATWFSLQNTQGFTQYTRGMLYKNT